MTNTPQTTPHAAGEEDYSQNVESFRNRLNAGEHPKIEDFWKSGKEADSEELLKKLLALEIAFRVEGGETPTVVEYESRFPDQMVLIADVFDRLQETHDVSVGLSTLTQAAEGHASRRRSQPDEPLGEFADYELLGKIAKGGMGVVYRARQKSLNRIVALKMILAGRLADDSDVKRFHIEATSAAKFDHPGIVPVFEVGEADGRHYLSMAYIEGESLAEHIRSGPLSSLAAAELTAKIAEAVHYAHSRGVVHRDLKPANVLLDSDLQPRITDFGLAKQTESTDVGMTAHGHVIGTPTFMPPEQAAGRVAEVGPLSDVYSLGAILYCLLTGRPPFQAATVIETLRQVQEREVVPPRILNPEVDVDIETICLKCLRKDSASRYSSASALADDIRRYSEGKPITARPVSRTTRAWMWCKRNSVVATLASAAVVLSVAVAVVSWIGYRETSEALGLADQRDIARKSALGRAITSEGVAKKKAAEAVAAATTARVAQVNAEASEGRARRNLHRARNSAMTLQLGRVASKLDLSPHAARMMLEDTSVCPLDMQDFSWRLMNSLTQRERRTVSTGGMPFCITLSPDEKWLAVGYLDGRLELRRMKVLGEVQPLPQQPGLVWNVAFSPDGNLLAAASGNLAVNGNTASGLLSVYDLKVKAAKPQTLGNYSNPVMSVAFSPDGKMLASGGSDRCVTLWNALDWSVKSQLPKQKRPVTSIAFSPDGKQLVAGGGKAFVRNDTVPGEVVLYSIENAEVVRKFDGHTSSVICVAISADGNTLATGALDSTARLWEIESGKAVTSFAGHGGAVFSLAFSPDGNSLATSSSVPETDVATIQTGSGFLGEIKIWNVKRKEQTASLRGHTMYITGTAFSANGESIFTASPDGTVREWSATPRANTRDFREHTSAPRTLAVSPDGRLLASSRYTEQTDEPIPILLWDISTANVHQRLEGHRGTVMDVKISRDGKTLASTGEDKTVRFWNLDTGKPRHVVSDLIGQITSIALSPDGALMAGGGRDRMVRIWDTATGAQLGECKGHAGVVNRVAFAPDGKQIASAGDDGVVNLWSMPDGKLIRTLKGHAGLVGNQVYAVDYSPDGKTLASGSMDTAVILWDIATGQPKARLDAHLRPVMQVEFSDDGKTLASTGYGNKIRLWDPVSGLERAAISPLGGEPVTVTFGPDGNTLYAGLSDGRIREWDVAPQQSWATLRGHRMPAVTCVAISPDNRWFVTGAWDRTLKKWDSVTGQEQLTLTGHENLISAVAVSPDGKRVASGDAGKIVKIWDAETGVELQSFKVGKTATTFNKALGSLFGKPTVEGYVGGLAFSPDSATLAAAAFDKEFSTWDVETGEKQSTFEGHEGMVLSVAYNEYGDQLAAGDSSKSIKIWNWETQEVVQDLKGHVGEVAALDFSRRGRLLASGSGTNDFGEIKIWNAANGDLLHTIKAHGNLVTGVSISDDGRRLVSSSGDYSVKLWDVKNRKLLRDLMTTHAGATLKVTKPVAISGDATWAISGGPDDTVQLWRLSPDSRQEQ